MGLVIATGLSIGTLFTLFVVPAFYMLLAADHHAEGAGSTDEHVDEQLAPT
jgi:multidrug efflux pump